MLNCSTNQLLRLWGSLVLAMVGKHKESKDGFIFSIAGRDLMPHSFEAQRGDEEAVKERAEMAYNDFLEILKSFAILYKVKIKIDSTPLSRMQKKENSIFQRVIVSFFPAHKIKNSPTIRYSGVQYPAVFLLS